MRAIRSARVVVAADEVSGRPLVHALSRMRIPQVTLVASADEARSLCQQGDVDACLVVVRNFQLEEPLTQATDNPAPAAPSILLADVVTPYIARTARRRGYARVGARASPPRLLYRLIGGALQKARRLRPPAQTHGGQQVGARSRRQAPTPLRIGYFGASPVPAAGYGKVKLSS